MKQLALAAFTLALAVSCSKFSTHTPSADNKGDFGWNTLTQKNITLSETSDLINEDGKIVATNLAAGSYAVTTGKNTTLSVVPAATKVDGLKQYSIPSIDGYATMMIEDLFPNKGDYDMNDVVIDFRVDYLFDDMNLVRIIRFNILPRAIGCPQEQIGLAVNLAGMSFLTANSNITRSSDGNIEKLFDASETTIADGNATIIPLTGDLRSHFSTPAAGVINAHNTIAHNQGEAFTVEVKLEKGIYLSDLVLFGTNSKEYNMDLFAVIGKRSKEIHMKGQKPTAKFDHSLMGGLTDFVTADNYVWMMVTDKSIAYPSEKMSISEVYPNFDAWVKSNGNLSYDWFDMVNADKTYSAK